MIVLLDEKIIKLDNYKFENYFLIIFYLLNSELLIF